MSDQKFVGAQLSPALAAAFKRTVQTEDRNVSQVLRRLIRRHVQENGNAQPPQPSASKDPVDAERARGTG
jgi:hypothetical protein